ncbi:hypothetical protein MINS_40130 [Mycolicibacterium insubricum]|jgi:hypothetical protein|uniref:Aminobenzoate oxygenase n=1 Tax=Mycolicibacterium insubricum TaxID=444597 RepID=A0A1X0DCV6_9MYCO|nr:diiron oxygenase [Mycolicibacterium insubricum]MCB9441889.1 diiron oxygenase [Mycolicibacterium sp.]MCV7084006.1 diiron oxygenase [Mycolicibacterium insubricum]ORA70009.1 aminobenzoate oxygenase [Mycolicibacterium insubricum]BBZ68584.1 hypothetical protein MINS_40130 [Mycolicibacterium insubricum]
MTRAIATTATGPAASTRSREEVAQRLLKGSVRKSYAPVVDIDWDAPIEPDMFFLPPELISIYGTDLWHSLSREQQIELSRQELVNVLSAGIWFENILNQALLRDLMHRNPTAASSHYKLTELGDETRHMVMFGKTIDRIGGVPVRPRLYQRMIINLLPLTFRGPILWGAALVGEEIFDALQRQILEGADVQPIVLRLMRIHVTEEARHIQFARDDLRKTAPAMPWYRRILVANLHGVGGPFYRFLFTHPAIYVRAGLEPREARRIARANPRFRQSCRRAAEPLTDFFTEIGLMGRLSRRMWRRAGFL